jgi:DNA-binding response OmpR family regulator
MNGNLAGQRVLLVEDDSLVSSTVEDILSFAGVESVEVAPTIERALDALARQKFDLAIMDINLNGRACWPVAVDMRDRGLPYLIVTGYRDLPENGLVGPLLPKPYSMDQLLAAASALVKNAPSKLVLQSPNYDLSRE